jgi:hypothetical protein
MDPYLTVDAIKQVPMCKHDDGNLLGFFFETMQSIRDQRIQAIFEMVTHSAPSVNCTFKVKLLTKRELGHCTSKTADGAPTGMVQLPPNDLMGQCV